MPQADHFRQVLDVDRDLVALHLGVPEQLPQITHPGK
jgi:hypothetical protein